MQKSTIAQTNNRTSKGALQPRTERGRGVRLAHLTTPSKTNEWEWD